MKCFECIYYRGDIFKNECLAFNFENYDIRQDCNLVNDDFDIIKDEAGFNYFEEREEVFKRLKKGWRNYDMKKSLIYHGWLKSKMKDDSLNDSNNQLNNKRIKIMKNKLKKYRTWKDITQANLSKEIGVGVNILRSIENDFYLPKYQVRQKICNYFKISSNQMFGDD